MRLWSLALLAIVLVGSLIAIARTGLFNTLLGRSTPLTHLEFADHELGSIEFLDVEGQGVFVAQSHPDNPLIMSGLPSYVSKVFRFPVDSRPKSGSYVLEYNIDVAHGAEGAMRVTINGVKRADALIGEGRHREKVEIALTPSELAASKLDVRLALVGRGPIEECTPGEAMAAVATILPESGLHLKLDQPLSTTRDRLALWGDLIPVKWGEGKAATATTTLIAASRLIEKGYHVYFGESGLAGSDLAATFKGAPDRTAVRTLQYPVSLVSEGANSGVRKFDRETAWRFHYNVVDLPNDELPSALDLHMKMGPLEGTRTTLVVDLNGRLLFTRRMGEGSERLNESIALPAADHMARNDLAITLTSHDATDLRCGANRMIAAEMLPETVLRGGGDRLVLPIEELLALLAKAQPVALARRPVTAPDAQASALLLAQLRPSKLRFAEKDARTKISVLTGDVATALAKLQLQPSERGWVLHAPVDRRESIILEPVAKSPLAAAARVALLVVVDHAVPASANINTPARNTAAREPATTGR